MQLDEAIRNRRSIRIYKDKPVEEEKIKKIIEAATWAPSACDIQGWKFVVVEGDRKEELTEEGIAHLKNAPMGIFVLYDNRTDNLEYQDHLQSAAAAIQNMLLKAHSLDLGTCWVCHLPDKDKLRDFLSVPWNYDPIALVTVGYPERRPSPPERKHKSLGEIVNKNKFNFDIESQSKFLYILGRSFTKFHSNLPQALKSITKSLAVKTGIDEIIQENVPS